MAKAFDIGEYVSDNLSRPKDVQAGSGSEMTATCPSCDKWGGFYINTDSGSFLCNKCDFRSKTVVGLVAEIEGLSWSEARGFIFDRSVTLRRKGDVFSLLDRIRALRPDAVEDEPEDVAVEMPENYIPVYDSDREKPWKLPPYLKSRKIKSKTARDWGLGFCRRGDHAGRLIIPIDCPVGTSWTARAMSDDVWGPKYLNPSGADHRRLLIGWHVARLTGDFVICEGPLDAVKLYQNDVSALALGGKELHDEQLAMLMDLPEGSSVTIMLDPEEEVAPFDIAARLSAHFDWIYVAKLPLKLKDGTACDPGNASKKQIHKALDDAKRWKGNRAERLRNIVSRSREKGHRRFSK